MVIHAKYRSQVRAYLKRYASTAGTVSYYGDTPDENKTRNGYLINDDARKSFKLFKMRNKNEYEIGPDGKPIEAKEGKPILAQDYNLLLFQNDPHTRILVTTYKYGSYGATMTAASAEIFDDMAPEYTVQYQAEKRTTRIDNERKRYETRYYHLISKYRPEFLSRVKQLYEVQDIKTGQRRIVEAKDLKNFRQQEKDGRMTIRNVYQKYFKHGTYDQVQHRIIEEQRRVFELLWDGFTNEKIVQEQGRRQLKNALPGLFPAETATVKTSRMAATTLNITQAPEVGLPREIPKFSRKVGKKKIKVVPELLPKRSRMYYDVIFNLRSISLYIDYRVGTEGEIQQRFDEIIAWTKRRENLEIDDAGVINDLIMLTQNLKLNEAGVGVPSYINHAKRAAYQSFIYMPRQEAIVMEGMARLINAGVFSRKTLKMLFPPEEKVYYSQRQEDERIGHQIVDLKTPAEALLKALKASQKRRIKIPIRNSALDDFMLNDKILIAPGDGIEATEYYDKGKGCFKIGFPWVDGTFIRLGISSGFGGELEQVLVKAKEILNGKTWIKFSVKQVGKEARIVYGHWDGKKWWPVEEKSWALFKIMTDKDAKIPKEGFPVTEFLYKHNGLFRAGFPWVDWTFLRSEKTSGFGQDLDEVLLIDKEILNGKTWVKFKVKQVGKEARVVYGHWDGNKWWPVEEKSWVLFKIMTDKDAKIPEQGFPLLEFFNNEGDFREGFPWVDWNFISWVGKPSGFGKNLKEVLLRDKENIAGKPWLKFTVDQGDYGKGRRNVYGHWDGQGWILVEEKSWELYKILTDKLAQIPNGGIEVSAFFNRDGHFKAGFPWVDGTFITLSTPSHLGKKSDKILLIAKEIIDGKIWLRFKVFKNGKPKEYRGKWEGEEWDRIEIQSQEAGSAAMISHQMADREGGIDFRPGMMDLQEQNNVNMIKFHVDQAMLQQLKDATGLVPLITNIRMMDDIKTFLNSP